VPSTRGERLRGAVDLEPAEHARELLAHVDVATLAGLRRVQRPARVAPLDLERPLDEVDVVPLEAKGLARAQARTCEREKERVKPVVLWTQRGL
jgi:hypothetical protein